MNFIDYKERLKKVRNEINKQVLYTWNIKNELYLKVDEKGNYKTFKGDTIVFFFK